MRTIEIVIGIVWVVFWAGWLAAATRVKSGRAQWVRGIGVRIAIFVVVVLLARAHAFRHRWHDVTLGALGLALVLLGLGYAVWARVHLGRNWGQPMTQKSDPELVTSGPYRWVRNPIYSGLILAMIGTAFAIGPVWIVIAALLGTYFVYSSVIEARFLQAQFPNTYPAYHRQTKMLIPFVF